MALVRESERNYGGAESAPRQQASAVDVCCACVCHSALPRSLTPAPCSCVIATTTTSSSSTSSSVFSRSPPSSPSPSSPSPSSASPSSPSFRPRVQHIRMQSLSLSRYATVRLSTISPSGCRYKSLAASSSSLLFLPLHLLLLVTLAFLPVPSGANSDDVGDPPLGDLAVPLSLALKPTAKLQCGAWQHAYAERHRRVIEEAKAAAAAAEAAAAAAASAEGDAANAGGSSQKGRRDRRRRRGGRAQSNDFDTGFIKPSSSSSGGGGGRNRSSGGTKYVVYDCMGGGRMHNTHCKGLGDMIRGVITTLAFALMSDRIFLINSPVLEHGFVSPFIDWRFPFTRPVSFFYPGHEHFHHTRLPTGLTIYSLNLMSQGKSSAPTAQVLLDAVSSDADLVVVRAHRGILHLVLSDDPRFNATAGPLWRERLGLRDPVTAFACLLRFALQPSAAVLARVGPQLQALQRPGVTTSVGVHVRTGDWMWNKHVSQEFVEGHGALFQCALMVTARRLKWLHRLRAQRGALGGSGRGEDPLVQKHEFQQQQQQQEGGLVMPAGWEKEVVWFFASDSNGLKTAMRQQWGDRLVVTPFVPSHINRRYATRAEMKQVVEEAVGEWALFAQCQYHIFRISGWSLTASLLTTNPHRLTAFIFGGGNTKVRDDILQALCNSTDDAPHWMGMSAKWGGL